MQEPYPYLDEGRPEMLPFVPSDAKFVLDVGCAYGAFARDLKALRPDVEVWGIEPSGEAAALAATRLDRVVVGRYPEDLPSQLPTFDCVVFNDVLEHLYDPWATLRQTKRYLAESSTVVASIPNVRVLRVTWPLLVHDRWDYSETGILDRTHVRFFTRRSMRDLFASCGYRVERVAGTSRAFERRAPLIDVAMSRMLGAWLNDLRTMEYALAAKPV